MVKVHNDTARHVLVLLRYLQLIAGDATGEAINRRVVEEGRGARQNWSYALASQIVPDLSRSYDEIERVVAELYNRDNRPRGNGNLIEQIAQILSGDWTRNRFNTDTLTQLRNILLLPNEQAAASSVSRSFCCSHCGFRFEDGQMATFWSDGVLCTRCMVPSTVPCAAPDCQSTAAVSSNGRRYLQERRSCPTHQEQRPVVQPATPTPPDWGTALPNVLARPARGTSAPRRPLDYRDVQHTMNEILAATTSIRSVRDRDE